MSTEKFDLNKFLNENNENDTKNPETLKGQNKGENVSENPNAKKEQNKGENVSENPNAKKEQNKGENVSEKKNEQQKNVSKKKKSKNSFWKTPSASKRKFKNTGIKIFKGTLAYPLEIALFVLYKLFTYVINIVFTVLMIGAVTGIAVGAALIMYVNEFVDAEYTGLDNLQFESSLSTSIYYIDKMGNEVELEGDRLHGGENRLWAEYEEMKSSPYLISAFLAVEDKRFFEHNGVDIRRTGNAVLNFFSPSGDGSGGSTITQQLIKNVSGDDEQTVERKIQEILRALNVEKKYSKPEILEMYLNTIYLSQRTNGVKAAALEYFGKEIKDLTLVECAALASIPKSPTKYDPLRNPGHNRDRRNLVLKLMFEQGYISEEQYLEGKDTPLELKNEIEEDYEETVHSYYIDAVIDAVIEDLVEQYNYDYTTATRMVFSGGLKIITTLDPTVQNALETVFEDDTSKYLFLKGEKENSVGGVKPQAAMVIMNPENGDVLGLVGGRGEKKESRGLNRATQSKRQCGSSIKPLTVYSLALEKGLITFGSAVDDIPTMKLDDKYWPGNTPSGFKGLISVNYAVMKSLNTIPVALVNKLTPEECFEFLTETLGFTSPVASTMVSNSKFSDISVSPMALGAFTYGVTTLEMCSGYCMFANGGESYTPRFYTEVRNTRGDIILSDKTGRVTTALSEQTAYVMNSIMRNVVSRAAGTGYRVTVDNKYGIEVAAKTGSTNDDRDRYFVGLTPEYVGACWFGYDNNKALSGYSVNPALSLWDNVMKLIYETLEKDGEKYKKAFDVPTGIIKVKYCTVSGMLPSANCSKDLYCEINGGSCIEEGYFAIGTQPTATCDKHILVDWDTSTKAVSFHGCSCPSTKKVALRLNYRAFDKYVSVSDSQYLYYPIPADYVFPQKTSLPFYANLPEYEGVKYFGLSSSIKKPYNRVCIEHYHAKEEEEEPSDNPLDDLLGGNETED